MDAILIIVFYCLFPSPYKSWLPSFFCLFLCLLVLNFIVTLEAFFRCLVLLHHLLLFQSEGKKLISSSEPSVGFIHGELVCWMIK